MERCVGIVKVDLMKNFCYHCGKELDDDAYSCPECGQLTEKGKANIQSAERKITALPAKPNLNPLISIAIVVILIGVAFSGMTFMTDKNGSKDPYHIDYEWSAKGQSFKYTLDIDKDDYTRMMKSDIDRSGTVSSDNYVKVVDDVKTTVNGVKDYIVVDKYIEAMAKDLKKMCEEYNEKTTVSNRHSSSRGSYNLPSITKRILNSKVLTNIGNIRLRHFMIGKVTARMARYCLQRYSMRQVMTPASISSQDILSLRSV